jgi:hypothetical protein
MSVALSSDFSIDPNTTNGTQLATILDRLHGAGLTSHAGAARPPYATAGTIWLDTSTAPGVLKWFDGANDQLLVTQSATASLMVGVATQAGHAMNLGQADGRYLAVSGGTATGPVILNTPPTAAEHATRKDYVDAVAATRLTQAQGDSRYINVAGDTMAGPLIMGPEANSYSHILRFHDHATIVAHEQVGQFRRIFIIVDPYVANTHYDFRQSGTAYAPVAWAIGSDQRLKTNIKPVTDCLARVKKMTGCTFRRMDLGNTEHLGIIAQDAQEAHPLAVNMMGSLPEEVAKKTKISHDDLLGLDTNGVIALLVNAVKELSAQVEALKARPGA